jgi:hypothetical protein
MQDSLFYIEKGYLDADENVFFLRHADACNCFGHSYKQFYKALARHAVEPELTIWFPKLLENGEWHNSISNDGETIFERRKYQNEDFIKESLSLPENFKRLVFTKVRTTTGEVYRFQGLYEIDAETSLRTLTITHRRKAKQVKTYPPVK